MPRFDAAVMVDWSAASRPRTGRDSVWIAWGRWGRGGLELDPPENPRTRREAGRRLAALLGELAADGARTLVGFDFPYAYPRGLARALGLDAQRSPWRAVWDALARRVHDDERNRNDRFAVASALNARIGAASGPFWGCPPRAETPHLRARRRGAWSFPVRTPSGVALERLRETERRISGVQETWKLLGAGSVGSQALTGIPVVAALRDDPRLAAVSRVWPFETGFTANPTPDAGPAVVHAEVWPGTVGLDAALHPVHDAAQVLSLVRRIAELDLAGALGRWLDTPAWLGDAEARACVAEEGWILGS